MFLIMKFIVEEVFIFRFLIVLSYTGKSVFLAFGMSQEKKMINPLEDI
jgi:hypothetical protein